MGKKKTNNEIETLKIAGKTSPHSIAGAIAAIIKKGNICEMTCIGAGPINQAVKGAAISRKMLVSTGISYNASFYFTTIDMSKEEDSEKKEITGIKIRLVPSEEE